MADSLYVHIPFCRQVCGYCDFAKARYSETLAERYLDELEKELLSLPETAFKTVYIGGGTPSALSEKQLERLLQMLSRFPISEEYTMEVNPESLSEGKALLMKKHGINRVSIGIQSFNERLLQEMERQHDARDITNTFRYLDQAGITNRSIDLIYGFHSQSVEDVLKDLETAVSMDITHVSIYDLEVHESTSLGRKGYTKADEETDFLMYQTIIDYLNSHGFQQYEISNFAKAGYRSRHNLTYWQYRDYQGAGLAACGKTGNIRYENTHNFAEYLKGSWRGEQITLSHDDLIFEAVMMGLRVIEGIDIADFNRRFACDLVSKYRQAIAENTERGLLTLTEDRRKVTGQGIYVLNDILIDFMN
ncbi:MAG: radical SAM family heme chaperone HemW [Erysipelotrichaceae bacterium]|nr:radical SAM family heme chaperone HemW [Erysipelotrichaceae bacterium]